MCQHKPYIVAKVTWIQPLCSFSLLLGERERAHLVVQLARIFYIYIFASSVSPDTVSLLNVSTRFYLGVHAVRNIATTVCMEAVPLACNKCHVTFIACQRRARMRLFPLRACSIMFSSARAFLSVSATSLSKPVQC